MKKLKFRKPGHILNKVLFVVALLATGLILLTDFYLNDTALIEVGSVSPERYVATRSIENTVATSRLKEEAAASVGPLYTHDENVQNNAISEIGDYFADLDKALEKRVSEARAEEEAAGQEEADSLSDPFYDIQFTLRIPVIFSAEQYKAYYNLSDNGKAEFKKDITDITTSAFEQGITEETVDKAKKLAETLFGDTQWNDALRQMGYDISTAVLEPNLVPDEAAMQAASQQKADDVEPVMVIKNQKIVDTGEVITEETYQLLTALNLINQNDGLDFVPLIGSLGITLLLFAALYIYFTTQQRKTLNRGKEMIILFCVYMFVLVMTKVTAASERFDLVPIYIFAMFVSLLMKPKIALILNVFVSIICCFIMGGGMDFAIFCLISGTFAALCMQFSDKRSRIIMVAVSQGGINLITFLAVGLVFGNGYTDILLRQSLYSAAAGIFAVIIAMGSLPLWEVIFGVNTSYRLMELTDPNNELMKRLMIETPGTYHHSLIVANLAETAANDIFANGSLARAGAYYHDIGKLKYPLYFSENQAGENVHDKLAPYISAKMIIEHVTYGRELAREKRIPGIVRDIIAQHHGTTLVKYFYMKEVKEKQGMNVDEGDFRYPGPIPQSREAAVVMLADTVEAAVRSSISSGKTLADVDTLIDALIKDKLYDGQLNDCMLNIKELDIIKKSFLKVFQGMYHDRIAYPKQEEIQAARRRANGEEKQK